MNNNLFYGLIITSILIVSLVIFLFVYYYIFGKNYTNVLCGSSQFKGDFNAFISNTKLPISETGNKYSYTFWINITNLPENSEWNENVNYNKQIIYRFGSPNVMYNVMKHHLIIQVAYKDKLDMINYSNIILDNLPNQKWTFIGIVVDNLYVDIYLDGKRFTSAKLPHVPFIFNRNIYLGEKNNNFNGHMSDIRYYNSGLNEKDIASVYKSTGNNLPSINY